MLQRAYEGSLLCLSAEKPERCEDLFDRVQIETIGEQQPRTCCPFCDPQGLALVAVKIFHDDEVSRLKREDMDLLDIAPEAPALDRAVHGRRCDASWRRAAMKVSPKIREQIHFRKDAGPVCEGSYVKAARNAHKGTMPLTLDP